VGIGFYLRQLRVSPLLRIEVHWPGGSGNNRVTVRRRSDGKAKFSMSDKPMPVLINVANKVVT
jgi:hypothetical protein